jgi:hypothetical protein
VGTSRCESCDGALARGICPRCGLTIEERALGYRDAEAGLAHEITRAPRKSRKPTTALAVSFLVGVAASVAAVVMASELSPGGAEAYVFCAVAFLFCTVVPAFAYLEQRSRRARASRLRVGALRIERERGGDWLTIARTDEIRTVARVHDADDGYRVEIELDDGRREVLLDKLGHEECARFEAVVGKHMRVHDRG